MLYLVDKYVNVLYGFLYFRELFPASFTSALGLQSLARVIISMVLPTVGGFLKEHFADYRASMLFLSSSVLATLLVWVLVDFLKTINRKK